MLLVVQIFWSCMTESAFGVALAWDPSPDTNVVGYAVQYGTNSGSYQTRMDVANQTNATIQLPTNGNTFFFVAIAYTVDGVESLPSNEVSYSPAATSTNQTITFGALAAKTFGAAAFSLNATASSGLPVNFSSGNPSVATLAGNTVTIVGVGSAVITASQAGNSNYIAAADVTQTLTVNQATATVTLSGLSATYDGSAKSATATTSPSGLPVTITYTGSGTAPVNAGSYAVVATVNHANYIGSASGTLTIARPSQTITFGALAAKTFGAAAFSLNATASSGLLVSYTSGNPSVATIAGNTVTIVGAGSAVITASQAGNSNYTAAANVTQTLTVNQATATESAFRVTLAWDPSPDTNVVGYAVQYGTNSGNYQTRVDAGNQTNATIQLPTNGTTFFFVAIAYTVDGVESLPSNEVSYSPSATSTNQTITFGALATKTFGEAAFPLSATASSGLAVSFTSGDPSVATIAGNTVTIVGAGSAVITASQAGDGDYSAAADVMQTLNVNAIPTVMISADQGTNWVTLVGSRAFVGSWRITATAFATAGLGGQSPALGFTSFDATSRLPGILMVRLYATGFQGGDTTSYYRSQVDGSVAGGSRLSVNTYVSAANVPFNTTAVSADLLTSQGNFFAGVFNSGASNTTFGIPSGPFSMMFGATISQRLGGGCVAFTNSLIATATPSPSGLPPTLADNGSGPLTIAQPDQTITFGALATKMFGGAAFPLAATASSGLPVSFSSGNPSVATISSNTVTIVGVGTAVITASQEGDSNYTAAEEVTQTLEVGSAPPGALLISQTPDGLNQQLRFSVGPGRHWQLQASADSLRWDTLCALDAMTNGWIDVFDPIIPSEPARSYRLVNAPTITPNQAVAVLPGAVLLARTDSPLNMQVRFSVGPNRHWQLQASEDFLHWTILCELTAQANGEIDIFDSVIPSRIARFYRVASAPVAP